MTLESRDTTPGQQLAALPEFHNGVNVPLLRKAVEFVEESHAKTVEQRRSSSQTWHQGDWSALRRHYATSEEVASQTLTVETCGTAYCVAGYVTSIQPEYKASVHVSATPSSAGMHDVGLVETWNDHEVGQDDTHVTHFNIAQRLLGLSSGQAASLFEGGNSADTVRKIAEKYAGEKL